MYDEGEPLINITDEAGRFITVFIGYSDYRRPKPAAELPPGTGPLWLLVDRPVFAAYYWVGYSHDDYPTAYAMPPIGKNITVPPIPGRVYIAPADPGGANVSVNGSVYELGPMDYLVINHAGGVLRVESSAPIAAVLVALRDGTNDTYMTELVPDEWVGRAATALFGSRITTIPGTGESMETFAAVVTDSGVGLGKIRDWPASIKIGEKFYSFDPFEKAAAVYYYLRNAEGDRVGSAAVAVYNSSEWWDYFGVRGYWVSPLKSYGPGTSTYSLEAFIPLNRRGSTALFLDVDNDGVYEAYGWVEDTVTPGPIAVAAPPDHVVRALVISDSGFPAYIVFSNPSDYGRVEAVPYAIPVPADKVGSSWAPWASAH